MQTLDKALYGAIIGREMGFFDANRTGELTRRLASDTQLVQNGPDVLLSGGIPSYPFIVGTAPRLHDLLVIVDLSGAVMPTRSRSSVVG